MTQRAGANSQSAIFPAGAHIATSAAVVVTCQHIHASSTAIDFTQWTGADAQHTARSGGAHIAACAAVVDAGEHIRACSAAIYLPQRAGADAQHAGRSRGAHVAASAAVVDAGEHIRACSAAVYLPRRADAESGRAKLAGHRAYIAAPAAVVGVGKQALAYSIASYFPNRTIEACAVEASGRSAGALRATGAAVENVEIGVIAPSAAVGRPKGANAGAVLACSSNRTADPAGAAVAGAALQIRASTTAIYLTGRASADAILASKRIGRAPIATRATVIKIGLQIITTGAALCGSRRATPGAHTIPAKRK